MGTPERQLATTAEPDPGRGVWHSAQPVCVYRRQRQFEWHAGPLRHLFFFCAAGVNPGGFCIGNAQNSCSISPIIPLGDNIELYSGPLATPTMLTGTFFFSTFVTNERYQLDIVVAPNGVVPEPGILAMLMIGFGLLGAMRQRSFIVAA